MARDVDDPEFEARFEREGTLLRKLEHPNIVRSLASVEADGTLASTIASSSRLPLKVAHRAPERAKPGSRLGLRRRESGSS